jgi:hypothetical protein
MEVIARGANRRYIQEVYTGGIYRSKSTLYITSKTPVLLWMRGGVRSKRGSRGIIPPIKTTGGLPEGGGSRVEGGTAADID